MLLHTSQRMRLSEWLTCTRSNCSPLSKFRQYMHIGAMVRLEIKYHPFFQNMIKIKCTFVQTLGLFTGCTAHKGNRGIALLFLDHSTRRGWGVRVTPLPFFTPGKDPVTIVQEAEWAPRPVWTGTENLAPTGIRSPDRPAHSQLLFRLRYPAQHQNMTGNINKNTLLFVYDSLLSCVFTCGNTFSGNVENSELHHILTNSCFIVSLFRWI